MTPDQLKDLLTPAFADADITTDGMGNTFAVQIVSDAFVGMRQITRQQHVYAILNDYIATGDIHALTIIAKTKDEAVNG